MQNDNNGNIEKNENRFPLGYPSTQKRITQHQKIDFSKIPITIPEKDGANDYMYVGDEWLCLNKMDLNKIYVQSIYDSYILRTYCYGKDCHIRFIVKCHFTDSFAYNDMVGKVNEIFEPVRSMKNDNFVLVFKPLFYVNDDVYYVVYAEFENDYAHVLYNTILMDILLFSLQLKYFSLTHSDFAGMLPANFVDKNLTKAVDCIWNNYIDDPKKAEETPSEDDGYEKDYKLYKTIESCSGEWIECIAPYPTDGVYYSINYISDSLEITLKHETSIGDLKFDFLVKIKFADDNPSMVQNAINNTILTLKRMFNVTEGSPDIFHKVLLIRKFKEKDVCGCIVILLIHVSMFDDIIKDGYNSKYVKDVLNLLTYTTRTDRILNTFGSTMEALEMYYYNMGYISDIVDSIVNRIPRKVNDVVYSKILNEVLRMYKSIYIKALPIKDLNMWCKNKR